MDLQQIGLVTTLATVLSGCATPHVVRAVQTADTSMTCRQLEMEMSEADRFRDAAQREKGVTGTNVAAVLFFWPAMIGTYSNANEAIAAADTRKAHLNGIYVQKKCGEKTQVADAVAPVVVKGSDQKLRELKELYGKELITKEEYDAKRAKIVSEM